MAATQDMQVGTEDAVEYRVDEPELLSPAEALERSGEIGRADETIPAADAPPVAPDAVVALFSEYGSAVGIY